MKKLILSLLILPLCVFAEQKPSVAAEKAGKTDSYQVTGPVTELTDTKIVITKGKERFELNRAADTKVEGELKVGAKATVKYVMTATTVEVKGDEKKADAKAADVKPAAVKSADVKPVEVKPAVKK